MLMWRASKRRSPTVTSVLPSTSGLPMSTVTWVPLKVSVLTPARVAIGSGSRRSMSACVARKWPSTRMPLPHISLRDPSLLR